MAACFFFTDFSFKYFPYADANLLMMGALNVGFRTCEKILSKRQKIFDKLENIGYDDYGQ